MLDYHTIAAVVALLPFRFESEYFVLEEMALGISTGLNLREGAAL